MDPEKIRALLAVLKEAGVGHFKQGDLEVSFVPGGPPVKFLGESSKDDSLRKLIEVAEQSRKARSGA